MGLIDWSLVLPEFDIEVTYSSLETDDQRDVFDGTVAEIRLLPSEYRIDVSWSPEDSAYAVRLYEGFFENVVLFRICKSVREVLLTVIDFAAGTRMVNTFTELAPSPKAEVAPATNSFVTI